MRGRRLPDMNAGQVPIERTVSMEPGDYVKWTDAETAWLIKTPNGHLATLNRGHTITENQDGTITVSPSILVSDSDDNGALRQVWHGYLENGVWREC